MGGKTSKESCAEAQPFKPPEDNVSPNPAIDQSKRNPSGGSKGSKGSSLYGTTDGERGVHWPEGQERFVRRQSSASCGQKPFERQSSRVSTQSGASVRTRLTSVSRSEYHNDLKSDLHTKLSKGLLFTSFVIVFGSSFLFGYNIGVLNQAEEEIKGFYEDVYSSRYGSISDTTITILWSFTTAVFIPGGMIGAFLGGTLADKLGRKKGIIFSQLFTFLGGILATCCVVSRAPEMLMLGRFLFGINNGIGNCLAPMYLSEISPYNFRGAFGTAHQLFITLGIFFSSVFGLPHALGTDDRWPFLMLLELLPAAISVFCLPFLAESPRYLLMVKKDRDGAEKAMKFFRVSPDISTDMEEMDTEDSHDKGTTFTLSMLFKSPDLRLPLFIACFLQVIQQFSGINCIFFYSGSIFSNAGVKPEQVPFAVLGTNAVNVVMTVVSVAVMDKAGRRALLLYPMIGMVIDLVIITISFVIQTELGVQWLAYVSVICVIVYVIFFAVGLGPIPMMIGAELFRQGPRPLAMASAGVVNWISTFVIAIGFPIVEKVTKPYTFIIFLLFMVGFTIFTYFKVPETKNKTFEEIAHQFSPGNHIEVEEVDEVFDVDSPTVKFPNANIEDMADSKLVTIDIDGKTNTDHHNHTTEPPLRKGSRSSSKSADEIELLTKNPTG